MKILTCIVITHKPFFIEMDNVYRCMRTLKITNELISKTKNYFRKI